MRSRLLGLALGGIALAGFIVVARHAQAAQPREAELWELLLALMCVPAAAVGVPLLLFGSALLRSGTGSDRPRAQSGADRVP